MKYLICGILGLAIGFFVFICYLGCEQRQVMQEATGRK